jgi:hypothetical protein
MRARIPLIRVEFASIHAEAAHVRVDIASHRIETRVSEAGSPFIELRCVGSATGYQFTRMNRARFDGGTLRCSAKSRRNHTKPPQRLRTVADTRRTLHLVAAKSLRFD